ncbi:MAG: adenosylcobalamin-dependent ribonucleoside-diphosphate reductase [Proteobacteria bacterium]|nr:adenosylcobalamin-dependent ribonucleoside-diphosphate reductase [Pseudomonadota bacterium]
MPNHAEPNNTVPAPFSNAVSHSIWQTRYCYQNKAGENNITDSWRRIAHGLAQINKHDQNLWQQRYLEALSDFRFLPGGRIQAGAGTDKHVTLFNCFVMGPIEDSMNGIFDALKQGAITMQQGGGVGYDFSTLRPKGTAARHSGTIASGPVSFMYIWDSMCDTLLSSGNRRGAMMATLRCDHPDIELFIDAKQTPGSLTHFNLSVLVTDSFMHAVENDELWSLQFPAPATGNENRQGAVSKQIPARQLWQKLMQANYDYAEPGVLFIDQINKQNNLYYRETISATNPCGEIPLPAYGACNLGSLNLTRFVNNPFKADASFNFDEFRQLAAVAVRMLNNVIDLSRYPLEQQRNQALGSRRIGLGITGLANCLIMLGLRYDSQQALDLASNIMRELCYSAYSSSIELAKEQGAFPFFDKAAYLGSAFIQRLPKDLRDNIAKHGIRNSHLLAIAPTGTISLLANNISSSLEPVFSFRQKRTLFLSGDSRQTVELEDYALQQWRQLFNDKPLPDYFVSSHNLEPQAHLNMQAAIQPWVDNAVSKTINIPTALPFSDFSGLYQQAWQLGLKGCTSFRPNPVTGAVLQENGVADMGDGTFCGSCAGMSDGSD